MELTLYLVAATLIALGSLVGVILTIATMPGTWLTLLIAVLVQWWRPQTFDWRTLAAAFALAVLAEIAELIAGGAGASKAGGSGRAAVWAIVGAIVGAILGTAVLPIPIVGTVVGGIAGAAGAAAIAEKSLGKSWSDSAKVATGAAVGRAASIVIKTLFAVAISLLLTIAAFVK